MPESSFEVLERISEAIALFDGEQTAAAGPLYPKGADALGKVFSFAQVGTGVRADGSTGWTAQNGEWTDLKVALATGSEVDLAVRVVGSTANARTVLSALWSHLAPAQRGLDDLGILIDRTTEIVRLPFGFEEMFPEAGVLRNAVLEQLDGGHTKPALNPIFRFHIEITTAVAARAVSRNLTIEPRAIGRPGKNVFYTQSPLPSDDHERLIDELVRRVLRRRSSA